MFYISLSVIILTNFIMAYFITPIFQVFLNIFFIVMFFDFPKNIKDFKFRSTHCVQLILAVAMSAAAIYIAAKNFNTDLLLGLILNIIVIDTGMVLSMFPEEKVAQEVEADNSYELIANELQELKEIITFNNYYQLKVEQYYNNVDASNFEDLKQYIHNEFNNKISSVYNSINTSDNSEALQNYFAQLSASLDERLDKYNEHLEAFDEKLQKVMKDIENSGEEVNSELKALIEDGLKSNSLDIDKLNEKIDRLSSITENDKKAIIDNVTQLKNSMNSINDVKEQIEEDVDIGITSLKNEDISAEFRSGLFMAKKHICIMSPWMTYRVVEELMNVLKIQLDKKLTVWILYGIGDGKFNGEKNDKTEQVANMLRKQFGKYENFKIKKINTHGKVFIYDSCMIEGSFNFLSFGGEYSKYDNLSDEHATKYTIESYVNNKKQEIFDVHFK